MSDPNDPEFVPRRFTNTDHLDQQLKTMAKQHYQGNISLCLRQAIKDHQATLNGEGRLTLKRLKQNVEQVHEALADLIGSVETIADETRTLREQQPDDQLLERGLQRAQNTRQVRQALHEADGPLRVDDLIERLEMSPIQVRHSLGKLIDLGAVMQVPGEPNRYRPTQIDLEHTHNQS